MLKVTKTLDKDTDNFVVQNVMTKEYFYFKSHKKFWKYYLNVPEKIRYFNEVIFEGKQKMRIDMDGPSSIPMDTWQSYVTTCYKKLHEILPGSELIVYDMSDQSKRSCHIITSNMCYRSSADCKECCLKLKESLPEDIRPLIDESIYNSVQHFRIDGSRKPGTSRYKYATKWDSDTRTYKDGLITYVKGCKKLGTYVSKPKVFYKEQHAIVHSDWCSVRSVKGNLIILDRTKPSYCKACCRIHESENPYLVMGYKYGFLYCRRSQDPTLILIKDGAVSL